MPRWTASDIPDQTGRTVVITGANSGIGLVAARELARAGAHVVMGVRNLDKGRAAADSITLGSFEVRELDLADLASVRGFAAGYQGELDLLINNAGVMAPPRRETKDGFESQLGTNHLGHFALAGLLLPRLLAASEPRVVTVSSGAHRIGRIRFDDLQGERRYMNWLWYGQSKLANLMFCFELQRRATEAGTELKSLAVHPGYARTNLQFAAPPWYEQAVMKVTNLLAQTADMGALPTLYAATVPDLPGGSFVGPDGFMEQRGYPHIVTAAGKAYDEAAWRRLWQVSEDLTGVSYEFSAPAPAVP
ncbi:MAG TPA: oxidoreductase [Solirubrobacteraceae bacterium]|nr:oxidoreductase [Solirubrobacteraceae bacterium]